MKELSLIRTIITIGIDNDDDIFKKIDKSKNKVINIIENKDLEFQKQYIKDEILIYELNEQDYEYNLSYVLRNNNNVFIICSDLNKFKIFKNQISNFKLIYYNNRDTYLDNTNYMNKNITRYLENEVTNACDLIITSSIDVYIIKKIIEKRNNIYFIDDDKFNVEDILEYNLTEEYIKNLFMNKLNKCSDEYQRARYLICAYYDDLANVIEVSNFINQKYKDKLMYMVCLNSIKEIKDNNSLIYLVLNNSHFDEDVKCELLYLNSINEYELMYFMIDLFIGNYESVLNTTNKNIRYKQAMYNYELKNFNISYEKYMELIITQSHLISSPMLNRNLSFIMYLNKNDEYKRFDYNYKKLLKSLA